MLLLLVSHTMPAQDSVAHHATDRRVVLVAGMNAAFLAGTYVLLNKAWYADYPRGRFHFFNDNSEWNQMDKIGHLWTAYHISRVSSDLWKWSGLPGNKSVLLGGVSAMAYLSIIEIQDGFSNEWGFSWGDMVANGTGAAAYVIQQFAWKEQRIQSKLSYWPYHYPTELKQRRDELFGENWAERVLKDYNSQTYWTSANMRSFLPHSRLPNWLNMAVGYSSDLMMGGTNNSWTDESGGTTNRTDIQRIRRFYLSPDIDLTKIKTGSRLIRTLFLALNTIKFPAPALEVSSNGHIIIHGIYF